MKMMNDVINSNELLNELKEKLKNDFIAKSNKKEIYEKIEVKNVSLKLNNDKNYYLAFIFETEVNNSFMYNIVDTDIEVSIKEKNIEDIDDNEEDVDSPLLFILNDKELYNNLIEELYDLLKINYKKISFLMISKDIIDEDDESDNIHTVFTEEQMDF